MKKGLWWLIPVGIAMIVIGGVPTWWGYYHYCGSACQQEAQLEQAKRAAAAQAAAAQQQARAYGVPAKTDECPGFTPVRRKVGPNWEPVQKDRPDAECDFVYAILSGGVEVGGPDGSFSPTANAIGRTSTKVMTRVRAAGEEATILYTVCPLGTGPENGGSQCKPTGPTGPSQLVLFGFR